MAALTVITPDLNGELVTYAAAAGGGDSIPVQAGGVYYLHVKNGHSSSQTVTINDPTAVTPVDAVAFNPDVAVPVVNATERIIRLDADRFRDSDGNILLTYSGVTLLTVAVYRAK